MSAKDVIIALDFPSQVSDLRLFSENDTRFLEEFESAN